MKNSISNTIFKHKNPDDGGNNSYMFIEKTNNTKKIMSSLILRNNTLLIWVGAPGVTRPAVNRSYHFKNEIPPKRYTNN